MRKKFLLSNGVWFVEYCQTFRQIRTQNSMKYIINENYVQLCPDRGSTCNRDIKGETERQSHRETERSRGRGQRDRAKERQRETDTQGHKDIERQRLKNLDTEIQRNRNTET